MGLRYSAVKGLEGWRLVLVVLSFGVVGFGSSGLASRDSDDLEGFLP